MFCPKIRRLTRAQWRAMTAEEKRVYTSSLATKAVDACRATEEVVFSRAACKRIAKRLLRDIGMPTNRFTRRAYDALAEAVQQAGVTFFEDCYDAAELTGHKTILPKHAVHVRNQWAKQDARVEATR